MVEEGKQESFDPEQEPDLFPPDPDGFDPGQRWKGVIKDALIEGVMLPKSFTALPVTVKPQSQVQWTPFDWKTLSGLQRAVLQYGMDSKLVIQMAAAFFKGQVLVPRGICQVMELLLPPTACSLLLGPQAEKADAALLQDLSYGMGAP